MRTFKNNARGFTLIELLVVITIIGILATLGVSQFTAQLQKTRDSKRISDIEKIKWALESYNLDNTKFPDHTGGMSAFTGAVQSYLPVVPVDQKTTQTCAKTASTNATDAPKCDYAYVTGPDSNGIVQNAFELSTAFEASTNLSTSAADAKDKGNCANRLEVGTQYSAAVQWPNELDAKCTDSGLGMYIR